MIDFCCIYASEGGEQKASWFITDGQERRRLVDFLLNEDYDVHIERSELGFKERNIVRSEEEIKFSAELLEECNERSLYRNYYRNNWITWCVDPHR